MKIIKIIIIFLSLVNTCWAHQDFYVTQTFGQVTVRFHTGFHYEEIEKAFIIGQYSDLYLKYYNKSNEKVLLEFDHDYTESLTSNYFINYSRGEWIHKYNDFQSYSVEPFLEKKAIIIRQIASKFDLYKTLKLLKYGINNFNKVKSEQKKVVYKSFYKWFEQLSIDTLITKNIVNDPINSEFENLISLRVYRYDYNYEGINYFMSRGKFYVCFQNKILSYLDDIDAFYQISINEALVFASKSEFYYVKYDFNNGAKQHYQKLGEIMKDRCEPIKVSNLGKGKVEILETDWNKKIVHSYDCLNNTLISTEK